MKSRRNKHKADGEIRKLFMQQLINTLKDSEFMEGVMDELIELYEKNTDEQNELEFDNSKKLSFQPNLGLGFKYNGVSIDYAITDIGDQSVALYSNVFSLKIDLGLFRR